MITLKRASALATTSVVASLALLLTGVAPASAATTSKSGSVTCTGTRTGYLVVQSVGRTRVILSSSWGGSIQTLTFTSGRRVFTAPNHQNFRWQVQILGGHGAGDIQAAYSSCRI